jgi:hypothetical protein
MRLLEYVQTYPDLADLHPYDHVPFQTTDLCNEGVVMNWFMSEPHCFWQSASDATFWDYM